MSTFCASTARSSRRWPNGCYGSRNSRHVSTPCPSRTAWGELHFSCRSWAGPLPERVTIYPPFYTDHGFHLKIGEGAFINQNCTFLDYAGIRLGERVMVGPKATFITVGHPVDVEERRLWLTGAPIDVAENVWIGAGATILPGVSVGRDAVIAAGAIVANDVAPGSLVAGPKATERRQRR